jgi:hypothetical protein
MKDYENTENTSFVLTRIGSLKIHSQKTGVKIAGHRNIFAYITGVTKIPSENVILDNPG